MHDDAPLSILSVKQVADTWNSKAFQRDFVKCYCMSPKTITRIEKLLEDFPDKASWETIIDGVTVRYQNCFARRPSLELIVTGDRPYKFFNLGSYEGQV